MATQSPMFNTQSFLGGGGIYAPPPDYTDIWKTLTNNNLAGAPNRAPTSNELDVARQMKQGFTDARDPMSFMGNRILAGSAPSPVDQYGWTKTINPVTGQPTGDSYNLKSNYTVPAGTDITASTVGTPPPETDSGWLSNPISSFLYKGARETGRVIDQAAPIVIPAASLATLGYAGGVVGAGLLTGEGAGAAGGAGMAAAPSGFPASSAGMAAAPGAMTAAEAGGIVGAGTAAAGAGGGGAELGGATPLLSQTGGFAVDPSLAGVTGAGGAGMTMTGAGGGGAGTGLMAKLSEALPYISAAGLLSNVAGNFMGANQQNQNLENFRNAASWNPTTKANYLSDVDASVLGAFRTAEEEKKKTIAGSLADMGRGGGAAESSKRELDIATRNAAAREMASARLQTDLPPGQYLGAGAYNEMSPYASSLQGFSGAAGNLTNAALMAYLLGNMK